MNGYTLDPVRAAQARLAVTDEGGQPLKQVDAARLLDVHAVTLNRIENGRSGVSGQLLDRMVDLYGCTREFLLGEQEQVDEIALARDALGETVAGVIDSATKLVDLMDVLEERLRAAASPQAVEQQA